MSTEQDRYVIVRDMRDPDNPKIRERACAWLRALGLDPGQVIADGMPRVSGGVVEFVGLSVPDGAECYLATITSGEVARYRFRVPLTAQPESFGLEYFREPTPQELGTAYRP